MCRITSTFTIAIALVSTVARGDVVLENFDGAAVGSYSVYGGAPGMPGTLTGWVVGGRYIDIVDAGGGDKYAVNHNSYSAMSVGTTLTNQSSTYLPAYDPLEALDVSTATKFEFAFKNFSAANQNFHNGNDVNSSTKFRIYFHDASNSASTYYLVNLGNNPSQDPYYMGAFAPGETKSFTVLLADIPDFDKINDRVFGFAVTSNTNLKPAWLSISYDPVAAPTPEPTTFALIAVGGVCLLSMRSRRRKKMAAGIKSE